MSDNDPLDWLYSNLTSPFVGVDRSEHITYHCDLEMDIQGEGIKVNDTLRTMILHGVYPQKGKLLSSWTRSILDKDLQVDDLDDFLFFPQDWEGLMHLYYVEPARAIQLFENQLHCNNINDTIERLSELSTIEAIKPIIRSVLRNTIVPQLKEQPEQIIDKVLALQGVNIKCIAFTYYNDLVFDQLKSGYLNDQFKVVMAWGPFMVKIGYLDNKAHLFTSINEDLIRYTLIKYPSKVKQVCEYLQYSIGNSYSYGDLKYLFREEVTNYNKILPLFYIAQEQYKGCENRKFTPMNHGRILKEPLMNYIDLLRNSPMKFKMPMPLKLELEGNKKWTLPAACQYFELQLDDSLIKCNGLVFMVLKSLEQGSTSLKAIKTFTKFPTDLVKEILGKLIFEKLVMKGRNGYDIVERFMGDDVVVIF